MKINEDILTDEGKVICDLTNIFTNKNREIERLNNVIDKFKEYIKKIIEEHKRYDKENNSEWTLYNNYYEMLDKIEELENIGSKLDLESKGK
jgi:hypothetical protein